MLTTLSSSQTEISFDDTSIAFASKSNFHLKKTYWIFALMNQGWLVKVGTFFIKLSLLLKLPIKSLIRATVFAQFCGGETIDHCTKTIKRLAKGHIGTILDYSVEGEDDETSFDNTAAEILKTIETSKLSTDIPFAVFKITGIGSAELMEKIQANVEPLTNDENEAFGRLKARLDLLSSKASELSVRLFIDAEESWIQDVIDSLTYDAMRKYNQKTTIIYNTYQLYRHDMLQNLKEATKAARNEGYFLGAKLVRGAYFEKERMRAHEQDYCDPIHATKEDTDRDFDAAVAFCIENYRVLSICLGTHNEHSCLQCVDLMKTHHIASNDSHIWFAQLLGMSDNISYNLAHAGYNVAKYVPYGPVEAVMPYLFRRADENKSIAGQSSREFLLIKREVARRAKCS